MNTVPGIFRILPEVILTLTGVAVMVIEPVLPKGVNRKSMGWLAVLGTLAALFASFWQYQLPAGTAFFGTIQTDAFSVFFHVLLCSIILISLLVAISSIPRQSNTLGEYFALTVFCGVGMLFMTSAVELLLVFIGLEISSISTYILAAFRRSSAKGPEAGIKYLLLGSFATAFFLYGIAMLFGATGTTTISVIAERLGTSHMPLLAVAGLAMILIGTGFKVSAAPFQVWTPDVYEGSPSPVVALMSTAPKAATAAVLLRILYGALPSLHGYWVPVLWWLSALSMTVGNLGALRQRSVKRMLAYSSIAHAGYLLAGFTALSADGVAAASFYAVSYAIMNVGIFVVISYAGGYDDRLTSIDDYRGLASRSPLLGGAMAFFLISLIGIPFTGGFFGKFYAFSAVLHSGYVWLGIIGLLNSGIGAFYYLRVITAIYSKSSESSPVNQVPRPNAPLLAGVFLTVVATLILGIFPGRVLEMAKAGAATFYPISASK